MNHIVGNENMNIGFSKESLPRNVLRTHYFITQGQKAWPPLFHRSKNITGISCFEPDNLVLASICILMKSSKKQRIQCFILQFVSKFNHFE